MLLNDNVKNEWRRSLIQEREDVVALDSAIILNPQVWVASGHVDTFSDPLVDCRTCKLRFRADKLEDAHVRPAAVEASRRVLRVRPDRAAAVQPDVRDARRRRLRDDASRAYLRPETAQGIFVNFKNVISSMRVKPPFGIAQIGKSFRNEITPGNFLFRMREFEQMEMEFFVHPAEAAEWHAYWIEQRLNWHLRLGLRPSHVRVRAHEGAELSHYSTATSDIEYLYPIGWQELEGVANRGDYDLQQHIEASGTKLEWIGQDERYVPHVIEPAISVVRSVLAFLCDAYDEEVVADRPRTVLRLHPRLAPVKAAVLPLIGKDAAMVEKARALYEELRRSMSAEYDDAAAIGKRYRRQDEIGTPWALTIDEQTLADGTVTLRDRDTLEQERIPLEGATRLLADRLEALVSWDAHELGGRPLFVWAPADRSRAYPTVYVLHAHMRSARWWFNVDPFVPSYPEVIDELAPDAVVVLVDGWTDVGGGQWIGEHASYLRDEVVPFVDDAVPDDRPARAAGEVVGRLRRARQRDGAARSLPRGRRACAGRAVRGDDRARLPHRRARAARAVRRLARRVLGAFAGLESHGDALLVELTAAARAFGDGTCRSMRRDACCRCSSGGSSTTRFGSCATTRRRCAPGAVSGSTRAAGRVLPRSRRAALRDALLAAGLPRSGCISSSSTAATAA